MAVIEYEIHFGKGKPYVTSKVVEVMAGDKIRFKSNKTSAGIEYKGGSPFKASDSKAPQPNEAFYVGKGTTPEFVVSKHLTADNRILFDCGVIPKTPTNPTIAKNGLQLKDRYTGDGTPNAKH